VKNRGKTGISGGLLDKICLIPLIGAVEMSNSVQVQISPCRTGAWLSATMQHRSRYRGKVDSIF
jgi:hypothetical protein